ncbi:hypothetical protein CDL15_Pgr011572 [Punica granatum]|uniref:Uncharacterized protein n=1 Tax=Punica granatum TaxID=22663 RepID=A0A218Y2P2_PUNGR|nr:hypothetical protein CDL15_Pgr011572 [Punica granatum]PKI79088.1 hypothetical protein CRG98_000521 [Punica granatum]
MNSSAPIFALSPYKCDKLKVLSPLRVERVILMSRGVRRGLMARWRCKRVGRPVGGPVEARLEEVEREAMHSCERWLMVAWRSWTQGVVGAGESGAGLLVQRVISQQGGLERNPREKEGPRGGYAWWKALGP